MNEPTLPTPNKKRGRPVGAKDSKPRAALKEEGAAVVTIRVRVSDRDYLKEKAIRMGKDIPDVVAHLIEIDKQPRFL